MAMADLSKLKPAYLALLDLIRKHRIKTLGKTGLIRIPERELSDIGSQNKVMIMVNQLITDGVLGPVRNKNKTYAILEEKHEWIFNCTQTAEQIHAYKCSLIIEGSLGIRVDSHGGNYYDMYRNGHELPAQRLSEDEGKLLIYLIDHANTLINRDELAGQFDWTATQISSRLNSIRRKLGHLNFSEKEALEILPSYMRGKVMFVLR